MSTITPPELPSLIVNKSQDKYYVFTYSNKWNKELGMPQRTKSKSVGKFIPLNEERTYGEIIFNQEFIDEYPTLELFKVYRYKGGKLEFKVIDEDNLTIERRSITQKLHGGATWLLNNIIADSPIGKALTRVFSEYANDKKILSLMYYLVINKNNVLSDYEEFAESAWLPFHAPMCSSTISRLLKNITQDKVEKFLTILNEEYKKLYGKEFGQQTFLALDSTSITTYSKIESADFGHNKDLVELPQTNVLLIVNQENGLPVYYRNFDGNVPDVSTVRNTIADLARLGITNNNNIVLVSDKGYMSSKNVSDCLRNNISFIFNTKVNADGFSKDFVLENYNKLLDWNNGIGFINQTAYTVEMDWKYDSFPVKGKRSRKDSTAKVYAHIYYDKNINNDQTEELQANLFRIKDKYNTKPEQITSIEQEFIKTYMTVKDNHAEINMHTVNEHLKLSGFRVLISDTVKDPLACYIAYEERNQVEYAFNTLKSRLSCNRTRVHDLKAWNGKLFIQVLASALAGMVRSRIIKYNDKAKNSNKQLRVVYDSDGKILNKLNNIMMTKFRDGWYFDEITGKKKELFKILNTTVPTSNQVIDNFELSEAEESEVEDHDKELKKLLNSL